MHTTISKVEKWAQVSSC